jgi:hypothetical protein
MAFPLADWQFWTVTAGALAAVWVVVRPFLRRSTPRTAAPCSHCRCPPAPPARPDPAQDRLVTIGPPPMLVRTSKRSASDV